MTKILSAEELADLQLEADRKRYGLLAKVRLKVEQVDPEDVTVPDRLRVLNQSRVVKLAESMAVIGLQQPITIWRDDPEGAQDTLYLVAGAHRLAAAIKLRWFEIDVVYVDDLTEIDRQIWEIDENLMRAELSPMEHANHVTRRAKLLEARPKLGGKTFPTKPQHEWGSAAYIAEITGLSKRAVNLALSRGRDIPEDVQEQIKGTKLDKGVYLDAIKGLEPEEQRTKVNADLAAPPKPKLPSPKEAREVARATNRMVAASDGNLYSGATEEEGAEHVRLRTQAYSVIKAINTIVDIGVSPEQWCEEVKKHWLNRFEFGRIDIAAEWLLELKREFARQSLMFDVEANAE